jgi:predicted dehydrogenase
MKRFPPTPLKVVTIGAGYFSAFHHDAWTRLPEVELAAVCDLDPAKAQAMAERFGVPRHYTDVATMLEAERPDLVDIATPPATHVALIRETMARQLPTICQKAFCRSLAEAREAVALAAAAGTLLIVHENFRFEPWHRELKRQLDAGRIGALYQIAFRLRPGDGQGPGAYLDRQPYFQTMQRFLVHETAIHFIDVFRYLMGEPQAVMARLVGLNPAIQGEDSGIILFEFDGNRRALFDGNRLVDHAADNRRLTMGELLAEGSTGVIRLDGYGRLFHRAFGSNEETAIAYAWEDRGFAGDSVLALQRHVVEHLLEGTPIVNTALEYLKNLEIEEAVYRASAEARLVRL